MGQCGQGHVHTPIVRPVKVKFSNTEGVSIHQISAGTSHSMAWTTLPLDNTSLSMQKPFFIDITHLTFDMLKKLLMILDTGESKDSLKSVLKILSAHLGIVSAVQSPLMPDIPADDKKQLEELLYNLVDSSSCPQVC